MAEGLRLDHWKFEFSKLSFTISRGRCITWGVSVFFPIDASVTCYRPFRLSTPGKLLRPEVFAPSSPVSNGDVLRAEAAHRLIKKLQNLSIILHCVDSPQFNVVAFKLDAHTHFAARVRSADIEETPLNSSHRRRRTKAKEEVTRGSRKLKPITPPLKGKGIHILLFLMRPFPHGVLDTCRLTDKFAKKGIYASQGENGDFMRQYARCIF